MGSIQNRANGITHPIANVSDLLQGSVISLITMITKFTHEIRDAKK
jgi:hypothetical protein